MSQTNTSLDVIGELFSCLIQIGLYLGYAMSGPLGLWVLIDEWGYSTGLSFFNAILIILPFGGLINWLFWYF